MFIKMAKAYNVICLPFAGGNKYSYRPYSDKCPEFVKLVTLEYPGRGSRIKEPLLSDINELVTDLYEQCSALIDQADYALYGHSMGGLLAYLLTRKIADNNRKAPIHLFITGTSGPSAPGRLEKKRSLMGKNEFIQEIKDFGGMPDEILQNDELLFFFEPILRADFKVSENYQHKITLPLTMPLTVITGTEEDMESSDIKTWQKETTEPVDFKVMAGNHFFIYKHADQIIRIIATKLYDTKLSGS